MSSRPGPGDGPEIDLDEARRLIDALERDLEKVRGGAGDVQVLRDEVRTLKNVLDSPVQRHHWVREGLHAVRENIENRVDSAIAEAINAGRYVSEIARILGL